MTSPQVPAKSNGWRVARPTLQPLRPDVEGLMEPGVDALPVRITIVQDGATTGWDEGALGFEAGAVWFNGRATSFRLAAPDILPGEHKLSPSEPVTDGEALRQGFPLRHPTREVWVRVQVLKVDDRKDWEDEARLVHKVKRLRALSEGGGPSQYPPLTPRPGMIEPPTSPLRRVVAIGAGFPITMLGAIFADVAHWRLGSLFAAAGVLLTLAYSASSPNQEALRRIAQEEGEN